jgi:PHD/YefM family antitoxin component YafN of YafNO toxin-antitoxin module
MKNINEKIKDMLQETVDITRLNSPGRVDDLRQRLARDVYT